MKPSRGISSTAIALGACCALLTAVSPSMAADATDAQFEMMDADKDGRISPAEHQQGARKMFVGMDANKDNNVTSREMDTASPAPDAQTREPALSAAEKIKVVDTNGDGILSAAEHAAGSVAMFDRMDANKDRLLTREELRAGHASMLKKPR